MTVDLWGCMNVRVSNVSNFYAKLRLAKMTCCWFKSYNEWTDLIVIFNSL